MILPFNINIFSFLMEPLIPCHLLMAILNGGERLFRASVMFSRLRVDKFNNVSGIVTLD